MATLLGLTPDPDATYDDDPDDPSVKVHQQDHTALNPFLNQFDVTTPDNGALWSYDSSAGLWVPQPKMTLRARDYGPVGEADDRATIQAALDAAPLGATVELEPNMLHNIGKISAGDPRGLVIPTRVTLKGGGHTKSRVPYAGLHAIEAMDTLVELEGVYSRVDGVDADSNSAADNGFLITADDVMLKDWGAKNAHLYGLYSTGARGKMANFMVYNDSATDTTNTGILLGGLDWLVAGPFQVLGWRTRGIVAASGGCMWFGPAHITASGATMAAIGVYSLEILTGQAQKFFGFYLDGTGSQDATHKSACVLQTAGLGTELHGFRFHVNDADAAALITRAGGSIQVFGGGGTRGSSGDFDYLMYNPSSADKVIGTGGKGSVAQYNNSGPGVSLGLDP